MPIHPSPPKAPCVSCPASTVGARTVGADTACTLLPAPLITTIPAACAAPSVGRKSAAGFGRLPAVMRTAIVIGGGVAGTSIARSLAARGVGVTVLEKAGQLCAGATWHAAGLVTRFGGSPKIKKVHVHALELMMKMHEEVGVGLHLTGSIRLIERGDHDRLLEAKQHLAMARLYDVDPALPTSMLSPSEVAELHPLVDISRIECGLYTPKDGDVDPTMLTTAISRYAKADGATFRFNAEVQSLSKRPDGGFDVSVGGSAEGSGVEVLSADAVVNCAGLWSRRFSNMLGMNHPAVSHPTPLPHPRLPSPY